MSLLRLYHGSSQIVTHPKYGKGRLYNDYGQGFYCTEAIELAREWACTEEDHDGFVNEYLLNMDELSVLNLSSSEYGTLNWLALLLEHRIVDTRTPVAAAGKQFLHERYLPPTENIDVIIGYRADDSYFTFARAFLRNDISLEQLSRAMRLGDLGEQVVLKSPKAFKQITFVGSSIVSSAEYYPRRLQRDEKARALYREEANTQGIEGIFMRDLLKESTEDACL